MSQLAAGAAVRAATSLSHEGKGIGADWVPVLADVPLFGNLSRRHIKRVASLARTRRFAAGAPIVRAGDAGRTFYVLLDGSAKVNRPGRRSVRLEPGAFFGEMALIDDSPRSADVVAEGEVLALTIDRSGFTKLLRAEPALSQALLRTLAARLRAAEATE